MKAMTEEGSENILFIVFIVLGLAAIIGGVHLLVAFFIARIIFGIIALSGALFLVFW